MKRQDRLIEDSIQDPYSIKNKEKGPASCETCGVILDKGKFYWDEDSLKPIKEITCPACLRIKDKYEGGIVVLSGSFLAKNQDEILKNIHNTKKQELHLRPLQRIISLDINNKITIKTTYEHLARKIGESVKKAFGGELDMQYSPGEKFIRVNWSRNADA